VQMLIHSFTLYRGGRAVLYGRALDIRLDTPLEEAVRIARSMKLDPAPRTFDAMLVSPYRLPLYFLGGAPAFQSSFDALVLPSDRLCVRYCTSRDGSHSRRTL
jgi:hypothetical protein